MNLQKAPRLKRGDLIGLVSPASTPAPQEKIERSVRYLEGRGYRVLVGANAAAEHGYLAGTDEQRAGDLNGMIDHPEVKAIFALRGGYGTPRILPLIDYGALKRSPKIIAGFSDITALQLAIYRRCRLVTFSGPMPAVEFCQEPAPYTEENFWRLITSNRKVGTLTNPENAAIEILSGGRAEGTVLGGNLSLLMSSVGTRFMPTLRDSVLVLEEVEEAPYRVDRLLTQLRNAGTAAQLAGVVFGQFTRCEPKDAARPSLTTKEVLQDFADRLKCPVVANFQYGHVPVKLTVPLGLKMRLDVNRGRIEIPESAVT